jgi:hypothetical protein
MNDNPSAADPGPRSMAPGGVLAVRIGDWRVHPALDEISSGDKVVKLEPRNMRLLLYLAAHPVASWDWMNCCERPGPTSSSRRSPSTTSSAAHLGSREARKRSAKRRGALTNTRFPAVERRRFRRRPKGYPEGRGQGPSNNPAPLTVPPPPSRCVSLLRSRSSPDIRVRSLATRLLAR